MRKNEKNPNEEKSRLRESVDELLDKGKRRTDRFLARRVARMMERDSALLEPLREEEEKTLPTVLLKGNVDGWFLLFAVLLLCFGAVMSFSASSVYAQQEYGDSMHFFKRYLLYAIGSAILTGFVIYLATPQLWKVIGVLIYGGSLLLLALVLVIGSTGGGAQRWIDLGFLTIQPSEIAKTGIVMMLALYLAAHEKEVSSETKWGGSFKHGVLIPGLILGAVILLVMMEKHISGIIIIGLIGVTVMVIGGMRIKWLAILGGIGATAVGLLILIFPYARARVESWINLENDPLGDGWQTLQGLYAIGSGGLFGVGLGNSRQKYGYVSEPQNDFIFSIICEELGFIGALLTIVLFSCLVVRGFMIAAKCPNKFCALVVYGLSFKVALQTALNIAVVTNSMPNTGISLPFFSSGGTSLVFQVFEVGIILSISRFSRQRRA